MSARIYDVVVRREDGLRRAYRVRANNRRKAVAAALARRSRASRPGCDVVAVRLVVSPYAKGS